MVCNAIHDSDLSIGLAGEQALDDFEFMLRLISKVRFIKRSSLYYHVAVIKDNVHVSSQTALGGTARAYEGKWHFG